MLTEQLVLLQFPHPGNLRSNKKKEVKARIRCIQALLKSREKTGTVRGQYTEKMRRLEMDNDILVGRIKKLEDQLVTMDKKKY